jgi:hypothetical protein
MLHGRSVEEEITMVKGHLLQVDNLLEDQIPDLEYAIELDRGIESSVSEAYSFLRKAKLGSEKLVPGGSKFEGTYDSRDGSWRFNDISRSVQVDECLIPQKIVETHRKVWRRLASIDLLKLPNTVLMGHRAVRRDGPKLDTAEAGGEIVIDNYGWGGVGWAIAPGAAVKVLDLLINLGISPETSRKSQTGKIVGPFSSAMSAACEIGVRQFRQ